MGEILEANAPFRLPTHHQHNSVHHITNARSGRTHLMLHSVRSTSSLDVVWRISTHIMAALLTTASQTQVQVSQFYRALVAFHHWQHGLLLLAGVQNGTCEQHTSYIPTRTTQSFTYLQGLQT